MADRMFTQGLGQLEKRTVTLMGEVTIGATGAPTLVTAKSKGIKSITRVSAGQYRVVLQDTYVRLFACWVAFLADAAPAAPAVNTMVTGTNTSNRASPQITFQCRSNAGAATDPASGEVMALEIALGDSSAP